MAPLGHWQQAGRLALHLDDRSELSRLAPSPWAIFRAASNSRMKPLGAIGVPAVFVLGSSVFFDLCLHWSIRCRSCQRIRSQVSRATWPSGGRRVPGRGVRVLEDHREGLLRNGGPDVLQVFTERDNGPVGLLDPAVAAEDFEGRAETGEDRVGTDDAFAREARHPFVDPAGKFGKDVAPVADIVGAHRAVGILARAADEMDGGGESRCPWARVGLHLGVDWPRAGDDPSGIDNGLKIASQLAVVLLAKTMTPIAIRSQQRDALSANALVISLRRMQCLCCDLLSSCGISTTISASFGISALAEQSSGWSSEHAPQPDVEEIREIGIWNCIVVWRIGDEGIAAESSGNGWLVAERFVDVARCM